MDNSTKSYQRDECPEPILTWRERSLEELLGTDYNADACIQYSKKPPTK